MGDLELEIKLTCPGEAVLARVLADPLVRGASRGGVVARDFVATYHDTPEFALLRQRLAFRQRRGPEGWRIGVKGGGGMVNGLARRREWEQVVDHPMHCWADLPPGPIRELLLPLVGEAALHPLFATPVARRVVMLALEHGCEAEMALDLGRVEAGERFREICEVELEWLRGPLEPLQALATVLCQRHGLTPATLSKFTLGLAMLDIPHTF